ncbi:hypothetical protein ACF0H5_014958 [Mactra antiquata]
MGDKPSRSIDKDACMNSDPYPRQQGSSEPFMFQTGNRHKTGISPSSYEKASHYVEEQHGQSKGNNSVKQQQNLHDNSKSDIR